MSGESHVQSHLSRPWYPLAKKRVGTPTSIGTFRKHNINANNVSEHTTHLRSTDGSISH